jgi:hypothetical protein
MFRIAGPLRLLPSALATTSEFVREKAPCASCRKVKVVIRRAA